MQTLSQKDARKLVLHSALPRPMTKGRALDATLNAINHLSYVQIDTISVVQRAHHHTLWIRNPRYRMNHLDTLIQNRDIFEYWSHAAAYLPISEYRFCLKKMKQVERDGHWFERDPRMMEFVLKRIRDEGPLQSRDFESASTSSRQAWDWKPAKRALEQLFMEGQLMTTRREGFQKVYDLTERVLPDHINTDEPSEEEWLTHLVKNALTANGIANAAEVGYLRKGIQSKLRRTIDSMIESGEIQPIAVHQGRGKDPLHYFALPEALSLLDHPLRKKQVKLLSPFDNLLIQRKRMRQLFDFDYQIECYVPEKKRVFGYFCLPILYNGQLVGRVNCKADRANEQLLVRHLFLEKKVNNLTDFAHHLHQALLGFCAFNQCQSLKIEYVNLAKLDAALNSFLN